MSDEHRDPSMLARQVLALADEGVPPQHIAEKLYVAEGFVRMVLFGDVPEEWRYE
jgi:hypothetical protein